MPTIALRSPAAHGFRVVRSSPEIHRLLDFFRPQGGPQVRLHPPEISLLNSRDQAREVLERAGFNLVEYYFGMRDLLVQAVVVGCKR